MDKNDEIKKKAQELSDKISETEKELQELRSNCRHSTYYIKDINLGIDSLKLRRVCKYCDDIIGFPSNQDLIDNGYKN